MNHCRGPNRVIGYAWSHRRADKPWQRFIIRECPDCDAQSVQPVIWVRDEYAMCMHCLSQDLEVVSAVADRTVWKCQDCRRITQVLPEPL